MQIKIKKCEVKPTKTGGQYKSLTVESEGKEYKFVTCWDSFPGFAELEVGAEVEGIIEIGEYNGKPSYKLISEAKSGSGTGYRKPYQNRSTAIAEAQATKAESIAKAQDRTAIMWAKYGAGELIAHHPVYQHLSESEIEDKLHELAGKILNDQLDPF